MGKALNMLLGAEKPKIEIPKPAEEDPAVAPISTGASRRRALMSLGRDRFVTSGGSTTGTTRSGVSVRR